MTTPLTPELAAAYMCSLSLISHRTPFTWRDVALDDNGHGVVSIVTLADTPTITRWFEAANLHAIGFKREYMTHSWRVTWVVADAVGQVAR